MSALFCAVQIPLGATSGCHDAVSTFIRACRAEEIPLTRVKLYGPLQEAMTEFARVQSDCKRYDMAFVKRFLDQRLAVIVPTRSGYTTFLPDGRTGRVPPSRMQAVPSPGFGHTYKGPDWDRLIGEP